jgi:hypothetical protein
VTARARSLRRRRERSFRCWMSVCRPIQRGSWLSVAEPDRKPAYWRGIIPKPTRSELTSAISSPSITGARGRRHFKSWMRRSWRSATVRSISSTPFMHSSICRTPRRRWQKCRGYWRQVECSALELQTRSVSSAISDRTAHGGRSLPGTLRTIRTGFAGDGRTRMALMRATIRMSC